jgi:UDP-glucose 4-epimerase
VIDAVTRLMNTPSAHGQVYNIGSTEEISINALAEKVIEMTGSSSKIEHISYTEAYGRPFDDMMRRVPDLGRVQQAVGYEPRHNLEATPGMIIEYQKEQLANASQS